MLHKQCLHRFRIVMQQPIFQIPNYNENNMEVVMKNTLAILFGFAFLLTVATVTLPADARHGGWGGGHHGGPGGWHGGHGHFVHPGHYHPFYRGGFWFVMVAGIEYQCYGPYGVPTDMYPYWVDVPGQGYYGYYN
jgi:uncharacterized membrane protein